MPTQIPHGRNAGIYSDQISVQQISSHRKSDRQSSAEKGDNFEYQVQDQVESLFNEIETREFASTDKWLDI